MIYDFIGIGFGPSNIALAVAVDEAHADVNSLYLERQAGPSWHSDMVLDGSDVQHNMLRDFITPVNPRSNYGFVSYLHATGRFFEFLNSNRHYPLRRDFSKYVEWVARQFTNVQYGCEVKDIRVNHTHDPKLWSITTGDGQRYRARALILGTGRNFNIPAGLEERHNVIPTTKYLRAIRDRPRSARIVVVGASQSAVEILLDLKAKGFSNVTCVHRSFSFRLKDTSPFSDEVYYPEFIDYYHRLPAHKRATLDLQVRQTNYSCADRDIIDALYSQLYEERLEGEARTTILRNHEIIAVAQDQPLSLTVRDIYTEATQTLEADLVILATGYLDVGRNGRRGLPEMLRQLASDFEWTGDYLHVERDYRVAYTEDNIDFPDLYLNGLCESSHGMGDAGSFSLVSVRGQTILGSILKRGGQNESRVHDIRRSEAAVRSR